MNGPLSSILGLQVLILASSLPEAVSATTKCEIHTRPCIDARTGTPRVCITTICRDNGEIITIDTIVLHEGSTPQTGKPKLPRSTVVPELKAR